MKKAFVFFLVLVLLFSLSISAFASGSGPFSGTFSDFPWFMINSSAYVSNYYTYVKPIGVVSTSNQASGYGFLVPLPSSLSSSATFSFTPPLFAGASVFPDLFSSTAYGISFFDFDGSLISSLNQSQLAIPAGGSSSYSVTVPSGTRFIYFRFSSSYYFLTDYCVYTDFYYDDVVVSGGGGSGGGSGSDYDPTLDQNILAGVTAIAQYLVNIDTGPYSGVTSVSPDANGDLQHTVVSNADLGQLLNAVGIASTDTRATLNGMYNNFGSFFTYYDITDSSSNTVVTVHGLPQYISALGSELTDGINRLQRDNVILYNSVQSVASSQSSLNTTLQDALYERTDPDENNHTENWSVADWLKGIFSSISSFFTNFWSPAETALKTVAEDAMQAMADNEMVPTAENVDDMYSIGDDFASFSELPVSPGDAVGILTDSSYYDFWSSRTYYNLSGVSPSRSVSPGDEVVDFLTPHYEEIRSVFGLGGDSRGK